MLLHLVERKPSNEYAEKNIHFGFYLTERGCPNHCSFYKLRMLVLVYFCNEHNNTPLILENTCRSFSMQQVYMSRNTKAKDTKSTSPDNHTDSIVYSKYMTRYQLKLHARWKNKLNHKITLQQGSQPSIEGEAGDWFWNEISAHQPLFL